MIESQIGPYELRGELAEGGMGRVFRAYHPEDKVECALKVLAPSTSLTDENVARFVDEAKLAARVGTHPNLVQVYDAGRDEQGFVWMAMELVEGSDLLKTIEAGHADPHESARLLAQVCSALAHVHKHDIVHRDLKPSNILIDAKGNAKLTDFGIAKSQVRDVSLTTTGSFLGTPWFMAPEQAEDPRNAERRTDIYGVGAILYMILTGRPPHQGPSALAVIAEIMERDPPPPSSIVPDVDRRLEAVCLKALSRNPEDRYADATQLKQALEAAVGPVRTPARGTPAAKRSKGKRLNSSGRHSARRRSGEGFRSSAERRGYREQESSLLMPLMGGLGLLVLLGLGSLVFSLGAADTQRREADGPKAYDGVAPRFSFITPRPNAVLKKTLVVRGKLAEPENAPVVLSLVPQDPKVPSPSPVRTAARGHSFSGKFKLSHGEWTLHVVAGEGEGKVTRLERKYRVDTKGPVIEAVLPRAPVDQPTFRLQGTCRDDSQVVGLVMNGEPVELDGNGSFAMDVELTSGPNLFIFRAKDQVGNEGFLRAKIDRKR